MRLKPRVFIAHASDAKDFARTLASRLKIAGFTPFFDERDLEVGAAFDTVIEDAAKSCSLFIFVVSEGSVAKGAYSLTELEWAVAAWRNLMGVHADGYDDVAPPPEISAGTFIRSRGDRVARTVSEVRRALRRPAGRIRKSLESLSSPVLRAFLVTCIALEALVLIAFAIFRRDSLAYGGSVYDKSGRPLPGVNVTFMGVGPAAACPAQLTDKQGGFIFKDCNPAKRVENPRVSLRPPGRDACEAEISLMKPPRLTLIRIDPATATCHPTSDPAVPVGRPCARRVQDAIERVALSRDLTVRTLKSDDVSYKANIWPIAAESWTERNLGAYEARCFLFYDRYRNDSVKRRALADYLVGISLNPDLMENQQLAMRGFTGDEAKHLKAHLSEFFERSSGNIASSIMVSYSTSAGFSLSVQPQSKNLTGDLRYTEIPSMHIEAEVTQEIYSAGAFASHCEGQE